MQQLAVSQRAARWEQEETLTPGNSFKHNALFRSRSIVSGRGSLPSTVVFFRSVRNSLQHLRLYQGLT